MRTVIFLRFSEPDGVAPSDTMGTLEDLAPVAGLTRPDRVTDPTWTGGGHTYTTAPTGWVAADTDAGDSLVQRDMTIQALVTFDRSNADGAGCLICRGLGGSTSERYGGGLELCEQAGNPGYIEIRWLWQDAAGNDATVLPGVYAHPGDDAELLITATRRWESTTRVVCRYYVNDRLLAEVVSGDGDIGGGTTGHTSIGARKVGGTWTSPWSGVIDQLKVADYEMSAEEVEALYERLTVHQPNGVASLRALQPPGVPWSAAPDSDIGRVIELAGQGLGFAQAKAEEQRRNGLPHRAYADTIAPWERLVGLPSSDRIPLDTRRERVVGLLSRDNGYAVPQVKQALSGPFDQAADDVEILEYSPTYTDPFDTLEVERWHQEPAAGAWSIVGGEVQLFRPATSDLRFDVANGFNANHLRTPITSAAQLVAGAKMTFHGHLPSFSTAGVFLYHRRGNDALWFGVRFELGFHKIGWRALVGGVMGAFTVLDDATNAPWWFRARRDDEAGAGCYKLDYSSTGFDAMTTVSVNAGIVEPDYVGVGAVGTGSMIGSDLTVTFDDFLLREPGGTRACHWYAFRDLGLPGSPDLAGANAVVRTIKPAHTYAAAITSRSLLCDDASSGCDVGPLGGL